MSDTRGLPTRFARWGFWLLALACVWITWVPDRDSLIRETAHVTRVHPHRVWVDVEITTDSGVLLQCSGKSWSKRCPEAAFQDVRARSQPILVWYKGETPYQVTAGGETIVDYAEFRRTQRWVILIVLILLGMGYIGSSPSH